MTTAPAFPCTMSAISYGMDLRDYFAAKALQAMVGSQVYVDGDWDIADIARQSYEAADAMIEARGT